MDPVGITKASATKARKRKAKINATAKLSTVSRIHADELVEVLTGPEETSLLALLEGVVLRELSETG
jgi:hypothetical protein